MKKSDIQFKRAKKYIPGGVNSPVRSFKSVKSSPFFVSRAKGGLIYDIDGKKIHRLYWILGFSNFRSF